MAKMWTLYLPEVPDESGVVWTLGPDLDAAWFPEYHRWSIDTDDAVVYVDFDTRHFRVEIEPDAVAALPAQLGFVPRAVFHVTASHIYPGSHALAERVFQVLHRAYGGKALVAA